MKTRVTLFLILLLFLSNNIYAKKADKINITSDPSGATFILLGSNNSYTTPYSLRLRPGVNYQIQFSKPGYKTKTVNYKGGTGNLHVNLKPINNNEDVQVKHKLTINCNINDAKVYINGQYYGETPLTVKLPQGAYNVEVKHPGFSTYSAPVNLVSNQVIYADLKRNNFSLNIVSNVNGAKVFINGEKQGKTPLNLSLSPGTYEVKVNQEGYNAYNVTINLNSNQTVNAQLELKRYVNIVLPKGSKIFINGNKHDINWGKNDDWKTFTLYGPNKVNQIRIKYGKLEVEKNFEFNGKTIRLVADLQ